MRVRRLLAIAIGTALLVAVPAAASASGTTPNFTSVQMKQKQTKNGFVITGDDVQGTKKIGTDRLVCTFVSAKKITCAITVTSPRAPSAAGWR